jgi:hypothetical protein
MDKHIISDKLEKSILDRVSGLLVLLPNYISTENENLFVIACDRISAITSDAFTEAETLGCRDFFSSWRRILTPWWKMANNKCEYAYGDGFTWKRFLNYIIESECTIVEVNSKINTPRVSFSDSNGVQQFSIELSIED